MTPTKLNTVLSIWHSKAFQYITLTICTLVMINALQRVVNKFKNCQPCELPSNKKKLFTTATKHLVNVIQ